MATGIVADQSTWTSARRRVDNKPFYFIPSSEDPKQLYMTARDGCTCEAARRSKTSDCKHQASVRLAERQQAATASEAQRRRMRDLMANL